MYLNMQIPVPKIDVGKILHKDFTIYVSVIIKLSLELGIIALLIAFQNKVWTNINNDAF